MTLGYPTNDGFRIEKSKVKVTFAAWVLTLGVSSAYYYCYYHYYYYQRCAFVGLLAKLAMKSVCVVMSNDGLTRCCCFVGNSRHGRQWRIHHDRRDGRGWKF